MTDSFLSTTQRERYGRYLPCSIAPRAPGINSEEESFDAWRFIRFERGTRYYELRLQQDLFGWVIVKAWGRTCSRLGQMRTTPCSSFAEASRAWEAGVRARQRRGYRPVSTRQTPSLFESVG